MNFDRKTIGSCDQVAGVNGKRILRRVADSTVGKSCRSDNDTVVDIEAFYFLAVEVEDGAIVDDVVNPQLFNAGRIARKIEICFKVVSGSAKFEALGRAS